MRISTLARTLGLSTLAVILAIPVTGCATTAPRPKPGTGDVAFRLRWDSELADLDLAVQEPGDGSDAGPWVSFVARRSEKGGFLDVDCNASPREVCRHPIENVFWPTGGAPEGRYRYRVRLFQFLPVPVEVAEGEEPPPPSGPPQTPVPFTVEVLEGKQVVERHRGEVTTGDRDVELEYTFRRGPQG